MDVHLRQAACVDVRGKITQPKFAEIANGTTWYRAMSGLP